MPKTILIVFWDTVYNYNTHII